MDRLRLFALWFIVVALFGTLGFTEISATRGQGKQMEALHREVSGLQSEIKDRRDDVQALESKHAQDAETIQKLQQQVTDLQKELEEAKRTINF